MKRCIKIICIIFILCLVAKICIKQDKPEKYTQIIKTPELSKIVFPQNDINITLNNVDFGKFGGEIILSTIGEGPKTFNPCNTKDATSSQMASMMYDGLLTTHPRTGEVIPLLAKSFEINGNDYIIHLRKGLKWTDGTPITVDDILYTYNDIVFKGLGNTSAMYAMMIGDRLPVLEKIDDYTVKFTTSKPFAPFLRQLSYPIVPKHYFKQYSDKGASAFDSFLTPDTKPSTIVSSGPFKLKEYVAAQRVVFERNPNYYKVNKNNERLPYLDKVIYLIVGDLNNEILKFEANETDEISLSGNNIARYKIKLIYVIAPGIPINDDTCRIILCGLSIFV